MRYPRRLGQKVNAQESSQLLMAHEKYFTTILINYELGSSTPKLFNYKM
jgi:hypothetical protein